MSEISIYRTVEDVRHAVEKLTTASATILQTEFSSRILSAGLVFSLQRKDDHDTKEHLGWYVSHVQREEPRK